MSSLSDYIATHPNGTTTQAGYLAAIQADSGGQLDTSFWGYLWSGQAARDAILAVHNANPLGAVSDTVASAASAASTIVNAVKWIGIVLAIVVGVILVLWIIGAVFGGIWALKILAPILPSVAKAAAKGALSA